MRYTEARLTDVVVADARRPDENAVDFRPTYDGTELEPVVLPGGFPNLLANGSSGIAVGMATNIPPHNVAELCEAMPLMMIPRSPKPRSSRTGENCKRPGFPDRRHSGRGAARISVLGL
jgi:topoisomerase-4 subunit A